MASKKSIALLFTSIVNGINFHLEVEKMPDSPLKHPDVKVVWHESELNTRIKDSISADISSLGIDHVIIAGYGTGRYVNIVASALYVAGKNAKAIRTFDLNELNALRYDKGNLLRAFSSLVEGKDKQYANNEKSGAINTTTLVIGGGIAGIQASLEIANSGNPVVLLERTPTIGGHMATFDKTFPTLDCAACILTPKMVDVAQHQNIELMTYCELKDIKGSAGNFTVTIRKKARRVNLATCIGCGTCTEKCPAKASSEFDAGTTLRKAIYVPFPQAVPNKYVIDAESCIYVKNGKCGVCVKECPVDNCINLDEKDEDVSMVVGNVIVTTGFRTFNPSVIKEFGYGSFPNVVTSLEFERLVNAAGPTEGAIKMATFDKKGNRLFTEQGQTPKEISIIHCVGSRDVNHNAYCSRVCCMYSLKLAHLVREKLPHAKINEFYIDMRAFGKGYEEFYDRICTENINMIRGRTAKVTLAGEKLILRTEDIEGRRMLETPSDMVILAVGMEPADGTSAISEMLNIGTSADGWLMERHHNLHPTETMIPGVFKAGVCTGPRDIPDTVAQASAAAAAVIRSISDKSYSIPELANQEK